MQRKPWYKQKRVIFTLAVLIVVIASFFISESDTIKIVSLLGMVITALGFIFQEAWTDKDFKNILETLGIKVEEEDDEEDNE